MASALQNLSIFDKSTVPSAKNLRFGIAVAEWNGHITQALFQGCRDTLIQHGALAENLIVVDVPGSFELPAAALLLTKKFALDAVICLGCVIKGETNHDEYINHAVAGGLVQLTLQTGIPHIFGLVTTNNEQQALDRAGGIHGNKGVEAAATAIRMGTLYQETR